MIYRLLLCGFLTTCAFTFLSAGVLADRILSLVYRRRQDTFFCALFDRLLTGRRLILTAIGTAAAAMALVAPGLIDYARTGQVWLHWSRAIAAVFLLQLAMFSIIHAVLQKVVELWRGQLVNNGSGQGPTALSTVTRQ
jgi:hypothetical protein